MNKADWDQCLVLLVPAGHLFCTSFVNSDGFEVNRTLLGCVLRKPFFISSGSQIMCTLEFKFILI